jgi:hypothetical protein
VLDNRTPMAVWRDAVIGALSDTAVDMTLRLDNARALPTYHHCFMHQREMKV